MSNDLLAALKLEWKKEWEEIMNWWTNHVSNPNGDFYGKVNIHNQPDTKAEKGLVLFARLLYTYSNAAIHLNKEYKLYADKAYQSLEEQFLDKKNQGYYWSVDINRNPFDTTKKTYGQAFVLYALVAYYELTNDMVVLNKAVDLFHTIENKTTDKTFGGYIEAFGQEWQSIDDIRLSDKDENLPKSMNTHLHVMEAYTALYKVQRNAEVKAALIKLIHYFLQYIICNKTYHLHLFFTMDWKVASSIWSYGHDIETSWLLIKAIEFIDDKSLVEQVKNISIKMLDASLEGLDHDGGLMYELDYQKNHLQKEKHWWPQAEAMVGCLVGYKTSNNIEYLGTVNKIWTYIQQNIKDNQNGEWYWGRGEAQEILHPDEKAGFWKCPYHNGRALMVLTSF